MKSAIETLNPTRVKLSVEVPFDELKPSLDAAYKKIGAQIAVPGFRKGRVPSMIIDQRVGRESVIAEAVNDALPELYVKALDENEITPLSQPEIEVDNVTDGDPFTFRAELDIAPKIVLPEFHGIEAEVDDLVVEDSDIDEQIDALRERFGSLLPVDREVADKDFVTIDLSAAKDGEAIVEAQANGMSYQAGSGTMLEGLDDTLLGMSAGDERTFTSTLVGGEYRDQEVDVTVKVSAVKEQELPDLDDDFAQQASEFDTVDELRADVLDRVTRAGRLQQAANARDVVLAKLLTMVDLPLPDGAIDAEKANRLEQLVEQLSYADMTQADYLARESQTEEEFDAELDTRVREAMAAQLILEEIAKFEKVGVDEGELTQQLLRKAQQAGVSPEEYVKHAVEHNHVPEIVGEVRRGKALAHVVESAKVTDKSGNTVELATLMPDGTYAEPTEDDQPTAVPQAPVSKDAASDVVFAGEYAVIEDDAT